VRSPAGQSSPTEERATLERLRELRAGTGESLDKDAARSILRELKAVGGSLSAVRHALTGVGHGPELWTVLASLDREETLRRVDAAL